MTTYEIHDRTTGRVWHIRAENPRDALDQCGALPGSVLEVKEVESVRRLAIEWAVRALFGEEVMPGKRP